MRVAAALPSYTTRHLCRTDLARMGWELHALATFAGHCHAVGKRRRAIDRDQARALLAEGVRGCAHCRPDTNLGVLG